MADAIISRTGGGTESVTLSLRNTDNAAAVTRDIGSPNTKFHNLGKEDPEPSDHLSREDTFTIIGRLSGSNAYADAKTLAEDIIKRRPSSSDNIELDLTALPSGDTHTVAATSESAVRLAYVPGVRQIVDVQLSLQVVDSVTGGSQFSQSSTSPGGGNGVKLTDGTNSVTLTSGLEVVRTVGRPLKTIGTTTDDPSSFSLDRPAVDVFDIAGQLTPPNAESDAETLEETLVKGRQGTDALTLHFQGGLFNLDAYPVLPVGSQALRTVFSVGETGYITVPTLKLRVVDT